LEERRRRPVEALTDRAAVLGHEPLLEVVVADRPVGAEAGGLGGEREQEREDHEDATGVERRRRPQQRPRDQRPAPGGECDRRHVCDLPGDVLEPGLEPATDAAAVPAEVEDERQIDAGGDEAEADHVVVALLEPFGEAAGVASSRRGRSRAGRRGSPRPRGGAAALRFGPRELHVRRVRAARPLRVLTLRRPGTDPCAALKRR
jgi:hypothetical protein